MKIANLISKLHKSIYQFSDINTKLASIIFTNVALQSNFDQKFPGAKQIFHFNEQQKESIVKTKKNQQEIIQFNDSNYLGLYVNKIYNNPINRATRFEYAYVEFANKDYWQHMYEIVGTMDPKSSTLIIRIKEDVLKECLECNLDTLDQHKGLFIQKIVNIGMITLFQITLKYEKTLQKEGITEFAFCCLYSKEDIFTYGQKTLLYKSKGSIHKQLGQRFMIHRPEAVIGEVYPKLE
ncbi:unnamed protein product [Paramecium pentaurelia]|uniref:Uncharacterized protein n=1 Tax=Paramecium pentaurelia TaxID=43138 RepID=A0A8S1VJN0_9CILI|nr:unnamed protein product [Paramecium pentaurelia]